MSMKLLFEEGPQAYFQKIRSTAADPWVFFHIPKTAGTSFRQEVVKVFPREANVFATDDDYRKSQNYHETMKLKFATYIDDIAHRRLQFISGHLRFREISEFLPQIRTARLMTFLRDPADRFISDYRYCCSPVHPAQKAFLSRYPSFEHYIADKGECNKMHNYLCQHETEDPLALAQRLESTFYYVGVQNMYNLSFHLFFKSNGTVMNPLMRDNVTKNETTTVEALSKHKPKIYEANSLDTIIYEYFKKRFEAVKDELWKALSA